MADGIGQCTCNCNQHETRQCCLQSLSGSLSHLSLSQPSLALLRLATTLSLAIILSRPAPLLCCWLRTPRGRRWPARRTHTSDRSRSQPQSTSLSAAAGQTRNTATSFIVKANTLDLFTFTHAAATPTHDAAARLSTRPLPHSLRQPTGRLRRPPALLPARQSAAGVRRLQGGAAALLARHTRLVHARHGLLRAPATPAARHCPPLPLTPTPLHYCCESTRCSAVRYCWRTRRTW